MLEAILRMECPGVSLAEAATWISNSSNPMTSRARGSAAGACDFMLYPYWALKLGHLLDTPAWADLWEMKGDNFFPAYSDTKPSKPVFSTMHSPN